MTTVSDLVSRALEIISVKENGQPLDAGDSDLCLRALSSLLDLWQLDPQLTIGSQEFVYTPQGGQPSLTIGPAGDIVATMPAKIDPSSFYRIGGVDRPITVADTRDQYNAFSVKTWTGPLQFIYYERGNLGTGTVYLAPAAEGTEELHLFARQDLISGYSALTLNTSLTLPNGYRNTLELGLAAEVMGDFNRKDPDIAIRAANALRKLKRSNFKSKQLYSGVPLQPNYGQVIFSSGGDSAAPTTPTVPGPTGQGANFNLASNSMYLGLWSLGGM